MAARRLSKPRLTKARMFRIESRYKGRRLNAAVPMAIETVTGLSFFNTWFRYKHGLMPRDTRRGRRVVR